MCFFVNSFDKEDNPSKDGNEFQDCLINFTTKSRVNFLAAFVGVDDMKRRIIWKLGDSSPDWANLSLNISGSGQIQITTGFSTSAAQVSFSRTYLDKILDTYGSTLDLSISVESVNDTGFILNYENIPESLPLEINYFAM